MALVSVVFSYRNEEEILPLLIDRLRPIVESEPEDFEFIFVDDDSSDRSVEVLNRLAETLPGIVVVRMTRKWGVDECFLAGLEQAKGDAVVFMYTDLQDPPELLRDMLAKWRQGVDIVHTVRRRRIGESKSKVAAAWLVYRAIALLSKSPIPVDAGHFKLMSRQVASQVGKLKETEPFLRGLIPWVGYTQASVEYDLQPRPAGNSHVPLFGMRAWEDMVCGLVSFSEFPVHLMVMAGSGASTLSLLWGLGAALLGGSALAPFLLLLWGTMMMALGIVGLYVTRTYKDGRGRPRWIVRDVLRPGMQSPGGQPSTPGND